ncbi:MAG: hypothetical protein ACRC62_20055 [Microcoleus sp.]
MTWMFDRVFAAPIIVRSHRYPKLSGLYCLHPVIKDWLVTLPNLLTYSACRRLYLAGARSNRNNPEISLNFNESIYK